ncbi:IS3 family transposase [Rhodobacter sp. CZR27]|uniref:IS3 family transposase n=1 Tax=Rhodobacter sp. CZR27 TaxID=2033869 RepID=UPI000BBE3340
MTSRSPYRRHSTPFKLHLCQHIRAGIIGRRDAQRSHNISANLIQLWLTQFDRGELTDEEAEASVIAEYEARIAALERKVGQLTMELDLVKRTPCYGYRRVTHELRRHGLVVNHKRVARVIRVAGLGIKPRRRFVNTTDSRHNSPSSRTFTATSSRTARAGFVSRTSPTSVS